MIRPLVALLLLAWPAAAPAQAVLSAEEMAGIGVQECRSVLGPTNTPVLAGAVDWGLGYLAGRRDGGHRPVAGEPLSTTDPADLAVGILLYCREYPYGLVLDALRSYGRRVFAEGPDAAPALGPNLPRLRPLPRPEDGPPQAVLDRITRLGAAEVVSRGAAGPLTGIADPAPTTVTTLFPEGERAPEVAPAPPPRPEGSR